MELAEQPAAVVPVAVLDLELTGLDVERDRVCEIAVVRAQGDVVQDRYTTLVRPPVPLTDESARLTGLSDEDLAAQPTFDVVAERVRALIDGAVVVCHNVDTDLAFLHREYDAMGRPLAPPLTIDTLWMARRLFSFPRNNLYAVAASLGIDVAGRHRAEGDAEVAFQVFRRMVAVVDPSGGMTVAELNDLIGALAPDSPLRLRQQRTLRRAFRDRRTVLVEYQDTSHPERGTVRREIGVWLLRLPYLQAWCFLRGGERVFRLDRARVVERGANEYEIPEFKPRI